jgi:hypothetical protein
MTKKSKLVLSVIADILVLFFVSFKFVTSLDSPGSCFFYGLSTIGGIWITFIDIRKIGRLSCEDNSVIDN